MENDPTTPKLESSTITMEKDLEEAAINQEEESFVITEKFSNEETDSIAIEIEKLETPKDLMTQSRYAQVVFLEISDRYPNDTDIMCKFSYNFDIPTEAMTSDRIGLYRVPDFAPHEYLTYQWVSDAEKPENNTFIIYFKANDLPKEEDFYQFQFLRTENGCESAIGASIPFQLQSPKNDELCTVEDNDEFMVVRSRTALATEKLSSLSSDNVSLKDKLNEMETKHRKLLDLSEKLQSDLEQKSQDVLNAEQELVSIKEDKNKVEQLKADLAVVVQDKCVLEERLHRYQKAINTFQMERDLLTGERDQAIREKNLLEEERNQILSKSDEFKDMLNAATKAKDLAVSEVRKFMLKSDEQQRSLQSFEDRVNQIESLNRDLIGVNADQKAMIEQLQEKLRETGNAKALLAEMEFSKNAHIQELNQTVVEKDAELEEVTGKLLRKEKEFEVLTQEMFERSKSKFREIDVLKKQLSEAERKLSKFVESQKQSKANESVENVSEISEIPPGTVYPEWINVKDVDEFKRLCDLHCQTEHETSRMVEMRRYLMSTKTEEPEPTESEPDSLFGKLSEIERTVKENHRVLQDFIKSQTPTSSEAPMSKSFSSLSTDDSRRLLDDQVIQNALNQPDVETLSPLKQRFSQVMDGFRQIEDSPKIYEGARPKSKEATPVNCQEEPKYHQPQPLFERSQNVLLQFLPQFSQSIFYKPEENKTNEQTKEQTEQTEEKTKDQQEEEDQFKELVNWQKASIMSCSSVNEDGVVITDDGRTFTEEEAQPKCPICGISFELGQVKALELHVDGHLATSLYCPVCNKPFKVSESEAYQNHVQEHFADEDRGTGSSSWFMDFD